MKKRIHVGNSVVIGSADSTADYMKEIKKTKNEEVTIEDQSEQLQSIAGKILTFHVMTDYGMMRSRVPISEIFMREPNNDIPFHFKQLWDCFSENVAVTTYNYLYEKRCEVVLRDGSKVWATYLMTVDWYNNSYSDEPSDYKCGHILIADDGYLLCQPNNRIYWRDSNWITNKFPIEPKERLLLMELQKFLKEL